MILKSTWICGLKCCIDTESAGKKASHAADPYSWKIFGSFSKAQLCCTYADHQDHCVIEECKSLDEFEK